MSENGCSPHNFAELNAWLARRCEELSRRKHPTLASQTIAECFQREQPLLRQITSPFAGYIEHSLLQNISAVLSAMKWLVILGTSALSGYYLPVLAKKPGALRHGFPFQTWDLPESIQRVRKKLLQQAKGDKAFVDCLLLAKEIGMDAFEAACELTLESGIVTRSIVLNEMRGLTEHARSQELTACYHYKTHR